MSSTIKKEHVTRDIDKQDSKENINIIKKGDIKDIEDNKENLPMESSDSKEKQVQKNPGGKINLRCFFAGCKRNNTTLSMKCVQAQISNNKKISEEDTTQTKKSYYQKKLISVTTLEQCGVKKGFKKV